MKQNNVKKENIIMSNEESYEFKSYGYYKSFVASEEHSFLVLDGQLWRHKKKIGYDKEYIEGKNIKPNGVKNAFISDKLILKKEARDVDLKDYLLTPTMPFNQDNSISNELAYLIGLCAADGCINHGSIGITSNIKDFSPLKIKSLVKSVFGEETSYSERNCHKESPCSIRYYIYGVKNSNIMSKYIVGKHTKKKFTKEVFNLSHEEILNLLGGYFDGDSSFNTDEGKLIANNYSEDMVNQLWWMLVKVGIRTSLNKYPLYGKHYSTNSTHNYRLFIPSSDVPKLAKYMKSEKVPKDFQPKKERELKFFYKEDGVNYFCQPIKEIKKVNR